MLVVAGGAVVAVAAGTIGVVDDEDTETFLGLPPFDLSMLEGGLGGFLHFVLLCPSAPQLSHLLYLYSLTIDPCFFPPLASSTSNLLFLLLGLPEIFLKGGGNGLGFVEVGHILCPGVPWNLGPYVLAYVLTW